MNTTQPSPQDKGAAGGAPETGDAINSLADQAASTLSDAKDQGVEQYEHLRDMATGQLESLVESAQSAASALEGKDSLGLSQYLGQLANGLGGFADQVRDKSAEDLLHQGAQLARDNPALFLVGSVAIGFGLSRFLRASASHDSGSPSASGLSSTPTPTAPSAYGSEQPYQSTSSPAAGHSVPATTSMPDSSAVADPLGSPAILPATGSYRSGDE